MLVSSLSAGITGVLLSRKASEIDRLEISYAQLISDLADRQTELGARADRSWEPLWLSMGIVEPAIGGDPINQMRLNLLAEVEAREQLERTVDRMAEGRARLRSELAEARRDLARITNSADASIQEEIREREAMQAELRSLRDQVAVAEREYGEMQGMLQAMQSGAGQVLGERDQALDAHADLLAEIDRLQSAILVSEVRSDELEQLLQETGRTAMIAMSERDRAKMERDAAALRIEQVHADFDGFRASQEELIVALRQRSEQQASGLETGLEMTGLDVDELIASLENENGEELGLGGPMTPADTFDHEDDPIWAEAASLLRTIDRATELQQVASQLPLGIPVRDSFRWSSGFGTRRDPFNGRVAVHEGVDLSAQRGTPIYVTGPGVVVKAERSGAYGNMVEIDHLLGLSTRYAHLQSISVEVGQQVSYGDVIGLMGSTGRSTGSHLHYEVRVAGAPRNPQRFLEAGQHVREIAESDD